ncbi:60s ribosomal l15 [Fusarium denticulatum]|uniref:Ribosomal protein L15 n=1 Tax=Fusarium denticulatum TaxID=48507 RepID=A0A8H5SV53_9HYPO|nr:60s ribosomal l15 [Fusarium denticulatum]
MPPRARKRRASATDAPPRKTTRAPRKPGARGTNQRRGKNFMRATNASSNKTRKVFSVEAKSRIKKHCSDFVKFIDKETHTLVPRIGIEILKKDISPDLAGVLPWTSSPSALQRQSTQPYPTMILKALGNLQSDVRAYEGLVKQDNKIRAPNWMRWQQDINDLEDVSKHSLAIASKMINHFIMPDSHELPPKPSEGAGGVGHVAWDLIEEALPKMPDDIWGKIAQGHLKAFTGDLDQAAKMGALKYVEELQKKKQSDVVAFLLRVRCWELRQLNVIHRASRPSRLDKARRLGYKAKQGYVIYRVRVRRGGRKRPAPKGATYGKPTNQGINQLKYQRSLKATAEERVGRRCANLRVLNSYWINQDSTYKYYEVILVDPQHKAIRIDPRINWIVNPVHKHRESRGLTATGKKSRGLNKGHRYNKTQAGRRKTWKRHNTLSLWRYR